MCDYVWIVSAPIDIRIKRVEQRDGLSKEEILKRVDTQKNEADLLRSSNVTNIQNDDMHPVLPFILSSINKFNINQIFSLTC